MIGLAWRFSAIVLALGLAAFVQPVFQAEIGDSYSSLLMSWLIPWFGFAYIVWWIGAKIGSPIGQRLDAPFNPLQQYLQGKILYSLYFYGPFVLFAFLIPGLSGLVRHGDFFIYWPPKSNTTDFLYAAMIGACVTLLMWGDWRSVFYWIAKTLKKRLLRYLGFGSMGMGGSSRFADFWSEWKKPFVKGSIFIGKSFYGRLYLGITGERHFLTIAGSRGGKGISAIIPNILLWPGNVVVIDPKGENAQVTARKRRNSKIIDPFHIVKGVERATYNPMAEIDADSPDVVSQINSMAEAIIESSHGQDPFWDNVGAIFLKGLIAHVKTHSAYEGYRDLTTVYKLTTLTPDEFKALLTQMENNPAAHGLAQNAAATLQTSSDKTMGNIFVTLKSHIDFLADPRIQAVLRDGPDGFDMRVLPYKPLSVYVCLPLDDIPDQKGFLRLMILQSFRAMTKAKDSYKRRTLFIMDEAFSLGRLKKIEEAAANIASYGVKLWPIYQNVKQIQKLYGENWETFVSNADAVQFMAATDSATRQYIAERLGKSDRKRKLLDSWHSDDLVEAKEIEKLMNPDHGFMIVVPSGEDGLLIKQRPYFELMKSVAYDSHSQYGKSRKSVENWTQWNYWGGNSYALRRLEKRNQPKHHGR